MPITGRSSTYPPTYDDWGAELLNNNCTTVMDSLFNRMEDATYNLERFTINPLNTGLEDVLESASAAATRPALLVKTYLVSLTGVPSNTKLVQMPAFSAAEKAMFLGAPLASSGTINVQIRKIGGAQELRVRPIATLVTPVADYSGDTAWYVRVTTIRDKTDTTDFKITLGTYVISLMISGNNP